MKLTPVINKILVRLDELETTFGDSVIIRPDIAKEKPMWGTIAALNGGFYTRKGVLVNSELTAGARVLCPWRTGHDMKINGRLHIMVDERDILAVAE